MSRTSVIDTAKKEVACALARAGLTGRWIAAYLGCDESTLRYALNQDDVFRRRFMHGRAEMHADHLANIARAAAKSWRASVWLLERLFPQQYNLRKRSQEPQLDELGFEIESEDEAHKPEESNRPEESNKPEAPAREIEPPPPDPFPMDQRLFEPDLLRRALAGHGLGPSLNPFSDDVFHVPIDIAPIGAGAPARAASG